jgi:hypothetical protein
VYVRESPKEVCKVCRQDHILRSIIGGDLNLPYADWNGNVDGISGAQIFINR